MVWCGVVWCGVVWCGAVCVNVCVCECVSVCVCVGEGGRGRCVRAVRCSVFSCRLCDLSLFLCLLS